MSRPKMRTRENKLSNDRQIAARIAMQRRNNGLCLNCGNPAREGKTQCQACVDYQKQRLANRRKQEQEQKQPHYDTLKNANRRRRMRDFIQEQKLGFACEKCGTSDVRVLDFHHREQGKKDLGIAQAVARGWSRERILQEIAKCQVLCSNCHRIVHWEERQKEV